MISIEQLPIVSDFREKHSITHSKLKERLEKLRISLVEDLMEPSIAFEITQEDKDESATVATMGNFSVITGKAKSKKTFFISMILSEILNEQSSGNRKIRGVKQIDKSKVLYFDTEQSKYHFQKICKRISNEIGYESSDDFLAYALRGESPKDRFEVIDYAIQNTENLGYVIIDGVRDLVTSINDETESSMMATSLLKWSEEKDIHIIVVLHQNPSNDKARGHLGTELMNKAETVFLVQVDTTNENNSSVVSPQLCRNKPFEPFAFYIDDDGVPILDIEYKTKSKNIAKRSLQDLNNEEIIGLYESVFKPKPELNHGDLVNRIKSQLEIIHRKGVNSGTNQIKEFIKHSVDNEWLLQNGERKPYSLNPNK